MIFNTYYLHNLHWAIVSFIYNIGATLGYSATSTFKCRGSTAAVPICEYLFTLLKVKGDQNVLKSCHAKNISQPGFLSSFILTIMVHYGKVYF